MTNGASGLKNPKAEYRDDWRVLTTKNIPVNILMKSEE
mgnify:CR=1 FL=1